jgi:hypothetical protein
MEAKEGGSKEGGQGAPSMAHTVDKGANVHAQGGGYGNALQAASAQGHKEVAMLLLDKGANVHAQGGGYGNALQAASAQGHKEVAALLLDKGALRTS